LLRGAIALLSLLFALQDTLLGREFTLCPPVLRRLGLQLLDVLLQPVDPTIAVGGLTRQGIALPLLKPLLAG